MITHSSSFYTIKIIVDIFTKIIYFPLWWYSRGLVFFVNKLFLFLQTQSKSLALGVWIKNIFTPMYGQKDWQGFLISVFMRFMQIIFRLLIMIFWIIISILLLIFWLTFPFLLIYEIIFQVTNLKFDWLWQLIMNN